MFMFKCTFKSPATTTPHWRGSAPKGNDRAEMRTSLTGGAGGVLLTFNGSIAGNIGGKRQEIAKLVHRAERLRGVRASGMISGVFARRSTGVPGRWG